MKKTSEESKYFLIILFSFWILTFPNLSFATLDDLDIASFYVCIENIDEENSILRSEKNEMISIFNSYIEHTLIAHLPLVWIPNLSNQLRTLNSKSLILRC